MKKIREFLEKWIKFEIYDTEDEGIYQIYAGIAKNSKEVDLSIHGFNLYFGDSKSTTSGYHDYGFSSLDTFKKAAILSLYYISRISAEEIVGEHIINAIRKGKSITEKDARKYTWEGKSQGCPERWSVFIDLRELE